MSLKIEATELPGVFLIAPTVHGDARGYFFEAWRADEFAAAGLPDHFVQDNVSRSAKGVLRGLHVQWPYPQGKLVQVLEGEIFDVAVDVRVGSPTFGKWVAYPLSADNHLQLYISPGIAHGFCVLSESALVRYKTTEYYHPESELTIAWDDPEIGVRWPVGDPILSAKDRSAPRHDGVSRQLPRAR